MKCTNKCLALLTALAVCFGATGCSDEAIAFSYNPDYKVSAFRISGDTGFETANAFASGLCVVNGDINTDNSAVDMTDATSAGLFDLNSRTVLYAKNIHERLAPASLTKLMTAVVALKYGNPNDVITVSSNMGNLESGAVVCGLAEGDQLTLNQALHALLIKSANDAAVAIAEHIGGSVEGFSDMMNAKAKELGCTNTHFANPHGLQDENHYTTAHDMALIAQAAYQNETFRIIIGTKMYTIPPTNKHAEETVLRNHHDMLCTYHNANRKYLYPYCVGGKTGYTATANSTLVTYAEKDGMTLICVVMNTQSPNQFIDTVNLFDYAFDNFQVLNVAENDTDYSAETTVDNGNLNNIEPFVELDKDAVIVLPKTAEFSDTSSSVEYNDSDPEIAGSITYTYAGRNVGKADIKTTGVVVEGYAFDNESTEEEEQEAVSTVQVRPIVVVLLIVAVILLGVLLFFLKRFYDNYYIIKHNRAVRRDRKDQKRRIRKKRRRRRRWR